MKPGRAPTFYRIVTPDGLALVQADDRPWPGHLAIARNLVEAADRSYLSTGDGMLRFTPDLGEPALYRFAHAEPNGIDHYDWLRTP